MKMKQKLAATLAGVMALSMVPATSVFAASTSTTNKVMTVTKGTEYMYSNGTYKWSDEDKDNDGQPDGVIVDKAATNAVFLLETTVPLSQNDTVVFTLGDGDAPKEFVKNWAEVKYNAAGDKQYYGDAEWDIANVSTTGAVYAVDGKTMQVRIADADMHAEMAKSSNGNYIYKIPYNIKTNKKAGDIYVTVNSNGTAVQDAVIKVATLVEAGLTAKTGGSNPVIEVSKTESSIKLKAITLTEAMAGAVDKVDNLKWFTISVDNADFKWINKDEVAEDTDKWVDKSADWAQHIVGTLGLEGKIDTAATKVYVGNSGYDLYVGVKLNAVSEAFGGIQLKADKFKLYKMEDAEYNGDVKVTVKSGRPNGYCEGASDTEKAFGKDTDFTLDKNKILVAETQLTVGADKEQSVTVKVDKTPTITAGRLSNINFDSATMKTGKITISETAVGSIIDSIDIEVPEGVKIIGINTSKTDAVNTTDRDSNTSGTQIVELINGNKTNVGYAKSGKVVLSQTGLEKAVTKISYEPLDNNTSKPLKLEVTLLVSVSADYEGDTIDATITTRYGDKEDFEEVHSIAKVAKPAAVSTEVTELSNNAKKQPIEDIVIKENKAGDLLSLGKIEFTLDEGMTFAKADKEVEVVSGDIRLGDVEIDGNKLTAKVTKASTVASEIRFTGLYVTTKNLSDGLYDITVSGTAIAPNDIKTLSSDKLKDITDATNSGKYADAAAIQEDIDDDDFDYEKYGERALQYFDAGSMILSSLAVGDVDVETAKPAQKVETETMVLSVNAKSYVADGEVRPLLAKPYIKVTDQYGNGDAMVPVRAVAEMLGFKVDWVDGVTTFTSADGRYAQWKADAKDAITVDGRNYVLRYAPALSEVEKVEGATFVWLRDLTRVLGVADDAVVWNGDGTITITAVVAK